MQWNWKWLFVFPRDTLSKDSTCCPSWKAEEDTKPPPGPQVLTEEETQHPAFSSPTATSCRPALLSALILKPLPELGSAETAVQAWGEGGAEVWTTLANLTPSYKSGTQMTLPTCSTSF